MPHPCSLSFLTPSPHRLTIFRLQHRHRRPNLTWIASCSWWKWDSAHSPHFTSSPICQFPEIQKARCTLCWLTIFAVSLFHSTQSKAYSIPLMVRQIHYSSGRFRFLSRFQLSTIILSPQSTTSQAYLLTREWPSIPPARWRWCPRKDWT